MTTNGEPLTYKESVSDKTKYSIISLGCSKNLVDSEIMIGLLNESNYELELDEAEADIIIINTCAFIESAKEEAIEVILEAAEHKASGKCKYLIVTGCLAQRYKDEVLQQFPEVDAVIGTFSYTGIADIIRNLPHNNDNNCCYCAENSDCADLHHMRQRVTPSYTTYLKIAEGCDNCCSYCVIPSIRGGYRSRKMEDILQEAKDLAADGVREICVIAQDTTAYGKDLYGGYKLAELLHKLADVDGIQWIRLHYCYPELFTDELIDEIANNSKICKYLDIPLQHINDGILQKMRRRALKDELIRLIDKLRKRIPGLVLRTTVIVGFPGEGDEQFNELHEFIRDTRFERLGVFTYSQEEGTDAAEMDCQVDEDVKLQRRDMLMSTQAEISEAVNNAKIGEVYSVLNEGYDPIIKRYFGRTYADSLDIDGKVIFTSSRSINEGDFIDVKITACMEYDLFGETI